MKKMKCKECWAYLIKQKGDTREGHTYANHLQRGGLSEPTPFVQNMIKIAETTYQNLYDTVELRKRFFDVNIVADQKEALVALTMVAAENLKLLRDESCEECGLERDELTEKMLTPVVNTLMKGLRLRTKDELQLSRKAAKRKQVQFEVAASPFHGKKIKNSA